MDNDVIGDKMGYFKNLANTILRSLMLFSMGLSAICQALIGIEVEIDLEIEDIDDDC